MSRSTISTFKIFEMFPDAESARVYLEGRLWPNGPICPVCSSGERIGTRQFPELRECADERMEKLIALVIAMLGDMI